MRTISASESNVMRPYHVLYGGDYVGTLERHPNRCEAIGQGPQPGQLLDRRRPLPAALQHLAGTGARHHPDRTGDALDATG
jgi:hypothetical protein